MKPFLASGGFARNPSSVAVALVALLAIQLTPARSPGEQAGGVDAVPPFEGLDARDQPVRSADYPGWIHVYTFADGETRKALMPLMQALGQEVARRLPDARIAYLNIADLRSVAGFLRPFARRVVRKIERDTRRKTLGA